MSEMTPTVPWCAYCCVTEGKEVIDFGFCPTTGLAHRWVMDATPEVLAAGLLREALKWAHDAIWDGLGPYPDKLLNHRASQPRYTGLTDAIDAALKAAEGEEGRTR